MNLIDHIKGKVVREVTIHRHNRANLAEANRLVQSADRDLDQWRREHKRGLHRAS